MDIIGRSYIWSRIKRAPSPYELNWTGLSDENSFEGEQQIHEYPNEVPEPLLIQDIDCSVYNLYVLTWCWAKLRRVSLLFVHDYLQMKKWKSLLSWEISFIKEKVIIYHLLGGVEGFYFVRGGTLGFQGQRGGTSCV